MPITPIPGAPAYQTFGPSPKNQRFGVWRRAVTIKDVAIANHTGLVGAPTAAILAEGSIIQKAIDGFWYQYGVTLPTGVTQAFISGAIPTLAVLIDAVDSAYNGTGNAVMGSAYFSGNFILSFLVMGGASPAAVATIEGLLKANDIQFEGTSQVLPGTYPGGPYGVRVPREDSAL